MTTVEPQSFCDDQNCTHPACWAARRIYKRNAYLKRIGGINNFQINQDNLHQHQNQDLSDKSTKYSDMNTYTDYKVKNIENNLEYLASIPTQKVYNILEDIFISEARDIEYLHSDSLYQQTQSMKHLPTPISFVTSPSFFNDDDEIEKQQHVINEAVHKVEKSVKCISLENEFLLSNKNVYCEKKPVLVWVPSTKSKEKVQTKKFEKCNTLNLNNELSSNINAKEIITENKVQHEKILNKSRAHRFFKPSFVATQKPIDSVDLFKLPADLLSEVLHNVDEGQPMTDESVADLIKHAGDVKHVLYKHLFNQKRIHLHNSKKKIARKKDNQLNKFKPVFLLDESTSRDTNFKLPLLSVKPKQEKCVSVIRSTKRSLNTYCQLMLGPVYDTPTSRLSSASISPRLTGRTFGSVGVECQSDRSTLLDELVPSRNRAQQNKLKSFSLSFQQSSDMEDWDDPWSAIRVPQVTRTDSIFDTTILPATPLIDSVIPTMIQVTDTTQTDTEFLEDDLQINNPPPSPSISPTTTKSVSFLDFKKSDSMPTISETENEENHI